MRLPAELFRKVFIFCIKIPQFKGSIIHEEILWILLKHLLTVGNDKEIQTPSKLEIKMCKYV